MIPNYKNVHIRFKLNDYHYSYLELMNVAYSFVKEGEPYQKELGIFLLDWLDQHDYILVKTSGSTGKPKHLKIKKQFMVSSAIMTGDFFKLEPGNTILSCLPSNFIAGKMMIVRALILGLELDMVQPKVLPLIDYDKKYDFCAFTPMQVENSAKYLNRFKTVIVGGGRVSNHIINLIKDKKPQIYETYGMTETVSHIAVKKLNYRDSSKEYEYFKSLPDISLSVDDRSCLVIDAPKLSEEKIVTNDIVKLHSKTSFEWLGRYDNVVVSGGVKLFPEQIEFKLRDKIKEQFFIAAISDDILGDKLVLIIENDKNGIESSIFEGLGKYEKPKEIFLISKFIETGSGKIHRKKNLEKLGLIN